MQFSTINSSDAEDRIFRIWLSIPCLLMPWLLKLPVHQHRIFRLWLSIPCPLMPWLLKSPVHQQAWYWLYKMDMSCSRVNSICLGQTKSEIWLKMWIFLVQSLKQFSMLRVNTTCISLYCVYWNMTKDHSEVINHSFWKANTIYQNDDICKWCWKDISENVYLLWFIDLFLFCSYNFTEAKIHAMNSCGTETIIFLSE